MWVSAMKPMQALRLFHSGLLLTTLFDLALFGPLAIERAKAARRQ